MKRSVYSEEGYRLVGAAFEVYRVLGFGMAEEIYQESIEIELDLRGIPFDSKPFLTTAYKDRLLERRYVPDLLVAGAIVTELKAVENLTTDHEAQLFNYLRISRRPVGYLLNFGHRDGLEWKRFILSEFATPLAQMSADECSPGHQ